MAPLLPDMQEIEALFSLSRAAGIVSNFGPCFDALAGRLSERLGGYVLPVANGTAAIQLAAQVTFRRGSRILVPDYTHIGTLQAVVAAGCEPVMIACDRDTWTIDAKALESVLPRFDGVVVVSPFGYRVDFSLYDRIARKAKRPIIYDLAGAWGINADTKNPCCYSLHGTKAFSCGEGGLIRFERKPAWVVAKRLSNFDTMPDRSVASEFGGNHKPDEMKCAVALAHLNREDRILARINRRRSLLGMYQDELGSLVYRHRLGEIGAPSLCVVAGLPADRIEAQSKRHGFVSKRYYPLLSQMPGLSHIARVSVSSPFFQTCLALPSDADYVQAKTVIQGVRRIIKSG